MNTTDIFIEHLISGVQVAIWVFLLFLSVFGFDWINIEQIKDLQLIIAVFLLPFVYPLGIIVDNVVDELLQPVHKKIRNKYMTDKNQSTAKLLTILPNEHIAGQLDYIRRRIRISRSTFVNMIVITISLVIFTAARLSDMLGNDLYKALAFEVVLGGIFVYLSWNSWTDFTNTQYKRVKDIYDQLSNK